MLRLIKAKPSFTTKRINYSAVKSYEFIINYVLVYR